MIIYGDCLVKMREMEDNSIDFIVCDPPYGLSFMNKKWDETTPDIKIWKEALRICKPGSMLAAFGGSRTHHHLMTSLEWAGWEIRDEIMWIFGQGFPKSHNFGRKLGGIWECYGTALKPSYEPIIIAMKPLDGTFEQNAEKWGVAGINIDESRIECDKFTCNQSNSDKYKQSKFFQGYPQRESKFQSNDKGRWPSNLILDEESSEILDEMTGILKSGSIEPHHKFKLEQKSAYGKYSPKSGISMKGDSGGASRFFYCAKTSPRERNRGLEEKKNGHPTVKPLSLMKYIIKLLSPPGDPICLDPFAGSGTTLLAAKELGIRAIGIEIEKEYCEIAEKRIASAV